MPARTESGNAVHARAARVLIRKARPDRSQLLRRTLQTAFLALNVWIGVQFYLFVRFYESAGRTLYVERPPGVEGWLPIAALMNLKALAITGRIPNAHAAGMFLLIAFLAISIVFRKAFCGWLCPVGTVSEALWKIGARWFKVSIRLPRKADVALRSLKYVLLGLFLFAVGSMSAAAIEVFLSGPYGVVADVRMLNDFRYLGAGGLAFLALLTVTSLFIKNFWCRFLCPYGALLGLAALASPLRVRRDPEACIDCGKCAKACPSLLPVDRLVSVRSAECTACVECVAACPVENALALEAPAGRRVPAWLLAAGIAAVFAGVVAYAQWSGRWRTDVPSDTYYDLIPRAQQIVHP